MRILALALFLLFAPLVHSFSSWDVLNDPDLMIQNYERNFTKLPLEGNLDEKPWNGNYWPTHLGGIAYRWNSTSLNLSERNFYPLLNSEALETVTIGTLSPAEKYDLLRGDLNFSLTKYEKNRTKIDLTNPDGPDYDEEFEIPSWEGLCHAWAPATMIFDEPYPIEIEGPLGHKIAFGASDIKALLTYFMHINNGAQSARTKFLGSRCNLDFNTYKEQLMKGEITEEQYKEIISTASCNDANAGAFHMVLSNQLGIMKEGFVADITRDQEVWNYPIFAYKSYVMGENDKVSPDAAPGTVKELRVSTTIFHSISIMQTWFLAPKRPKAEVPFDSAYKSEKYEYTLELDNEGNIVGGEWISESRPDFIWKQKLPRFQRFFKPLKELYIKSIERKKSLISLWNSLENGEDEKVKELLEKIDINTQDSDGSSPLHYAAYYGNLDLLKFLVEKGAKVDILNREGKTPLMFATLMGQTESVDILIQNKADVYIKDKNKNTLLHFAAIEGALEIAKLLMEKGVAFEAKNYTGKTPLFLAAENGNLEVVKFLHSKGASLNTKDTFLNSALHWSITRKHQEIAKYLLDNKVDVNVQNYKGMSALHWCVLYGLVDEVKFLLDIGAKPDIKDKYGFTPLDHAKDMGNKDIIRLLTPKHPEPTAPTAATE